MVWPIIAAESYVCETGKSMKQRGWRWLKRIVGEKPRFQVALPIGVLSATAWQLQSSSTESLEMGSSCACIRYAQKSYS
jgi:hypothetical protein